MSDSIQVSVTGGDDLEAFLAQIDRNLRGGAVKKAGRAAGKVVERAAKAKVSKPGYRGDKANLVPLRDSIKTVVREYGQTFVTVVGPTYPEGAHGHLVEFGHAMVLWGNQTGERVPPYPFMRPSADETLSEQKSAMESVLKAAMPSAG